MAMTRRGQSPARHTKVMDPCPGHEGRPQKNSKTRSHDYDVVSSKPASAGRAMTEDSSDQCSSSCVVVECSKHRCKTCRHNYSQR